MSLYEASIEDLGAMNRGNNRTVFRNPRGRKRFYSFYSFTAAPLTAGGAINYRWSEDGKNWNTGSQLLNETDDSEAVHPDFDVKIHDDGSQLEIFVVANFYNDEDLKYRRGTIADSSDTIVWGGSEQTIDSAINYENISGTYTEFQSVAIARTDNGRLVVAFTEDFNTMGKDYRLIKIITGSDDSNAPTWANETTVVDGSGNTNNQNKDATWVGLEAFDSTFGDRVLFYCRVPFSSSPTSYSLNMYVYTWNGSSLTQETSVIQLNGSAGAAIASKISATIGSDDKVNIVYLYSGTLSMQHTKMPNAGAVSGTPSNTSLAAADAVSLSINRTTNDIFYFSIRATQNIIYQFTDDTTISWSAEFLISTGIDPTKISSSQRDQVGAIHLSFGT